MEFKDYYEVLGVAADATRDEIRRAYRKLARRYHPDVSEEADAEARFKDVAEAWDILGDEDKRATYDDLRRRGGSSAFQGAGFGGGFGQPGGDPFSGAGAASFAEAFNDLFASMRSGGGGAFSGGDPFAAFSGAGAGPGGTQRRSAPQDATASLTITPAEAYSGVERALRLSVTDANGRAREKTLKVRIPAGVVDGRRIRLRGQGPQDSRGRSGDLYVQLSLASDPRFEVKGRDVHAEVPITPPQAVLGQTVRVETLGGPVDVRVPPGAARPLRLKGRGLPGEGSEPAGDHYLRFRITVPAEPSDAERALYEALARAEADR